VIFGDTVSPYFVDKIDYEAEKDSSQAEYWRQLANTYHSGMNRVINVLNSHADFFALTMTDSRQDSPRIFWK
jgi:hypothetical protein